MKDSYKATKFNKNKIRDFCNASKSKITRKISDVIFKKLCFELCERLNSNYIYIKE